MAAADRTAAEHRRKRCRMLRHLPAVLGVLLLVGAVYAVQKEFRHLKIEDVGVALDAIPRRTLVISFLWTILSYGILTFYDRLGTIYAGRKVAYGRVAFASFCAYALSHNLGFSARVRRRGALSAVCALGADAGADRQGGGVLQPHLRPRRHGAGRHDPDLRAASGAVLRRHAAAVGDARASARAVGDRARLRDAGARARPVRIFGHEIELPGWRMAHAAGAAGDHRRRGDGGDLLRPAAGGAGADLRADFLGVYVASYTAGLAANMPGGIGVFDTAMLFGLAPYLHAPQIVGAIVVFRLYYYIIPLFLAGALFAGNEILLRGRALLRPAPAARRAAVGALERAGFRGGRASPARSRCAASCCCASAWWRRSPTSPGSTPTSPSSPPRPASSCPS